MGKYKFKVNPINGSLDLINNPLSGNVTAGANSTFTNADLAAGVLTINHAQNITDIVKVTIVDPQGDESIMAFNIVDANNVTVDLGGAIAAGTWKYIVSLIN